MSSSSLHELWSKACENEKINREISKRWLDTVETKYNTESHRFYHNANILYKKCDFLQSINSSSVKISDYLIFAIVFQYFHFDLKSEYSEKNRDTFRQFYNEAGIDDNKLLDFVLLLLGDLNVNIEDDPTVDLQLFQDLDLIVFGSTPNDYKNYQQQLEKEYSYLSKAEYKATRLRILETFLQIPQIYSIQCVRDQLEDSARANIKQEISELRE